MFSGAGEALCQVATIHGISKPTLAKMIAVADAAKQDPERFGDLAEEMDETGSADGPFKELRRRMGLQTSVSRAKPDVSIRTDRDGNLLISVSAGQSELVAKLQEIIPEYARRVSEDRETEVASASVKHRRTARRRLEAAN